MDANCALGVESSLASGLRRKSLLSRVQRPRPALQRPKMLPRGSSQEYASTIGHHSHDKGLSAFIRFTRPHTILGTTISVCSMTFVGAVKSNLMHVLSVLGQALVPALLMNIAIVGLNQVYDKRIDMVNKPYLPLASGEFSSNRALLLISFTSAGSMIWGISRTVHCKRTLTHHRGNVQIKCIDVNADSEPIAWRTILRRL